MKKLLTLTLTIFALTFSNVHAQNADCAEKLSVFAELAKVKNYAEAYEHLQYLRKNCPDFHNAIYLYGESTLNYMIDNAKSAEEKEKHVRDLMKLFDEFDKFFSNNGRDNKSRKALALFDNNVGTKDEVYTLLQDAFDKDRENFTNARAMYVLFEIFVDNYEKGGKGIELQQVFDKYDLISDKLEEETNKLSEAKDELLKLEETQELSAKQRTAFNRYEVNLEAYQTIATSMDAKISLLSSCDRLIPFFSKSFDTKKGDQEWLRRAADRLYRKGCSTDPLFQRISEALHTLNPTANSAYNLGVSALNAKNTAKAMEYFNQAADLYKDNNKKADVYYTIATMYGMSNKSQARVYCEKALAVKPSYGKAYLFIAQLYANSVNECGNTPFEKRAVNWLAAQTARRAGQVDSSLKVTADQQAAGYDQRAPSRTDIFQENMAGQTIQFRCWIGKSVSVPNL